MILEKDSSVLGYPGEISKALDADHHGVCKYYGQEDPKYVTVRNVLKSLVSKVLSSPGLKVPSPTEQDESREVESILAISELPDVDYIFFRDRWVQGTCGWILENSTYLSWLRDSSSKPRMLWLHGGPASGKSVLSSFIINSLAQEGACCQYFFVRFGDHAKRSLNTLLRSLAYQIARVLPSFREGIRELSNMTTKLKSTDAWTIWQRIFKSILFKIELVQPLYWVIDGVEESDNPKSLVKLMSDALSTCTPIRILLVSRKTQELLASLQKLPKEADFQLLSSEGHSEDYRQFISQELDVSGSPEFKEGITRRLLETAHGNFLWVHLAVQRINKCHTEADIEQALEQLPPGMEALYDRMAQSIADNPREGDRKLASSILTWATCALRLLTVGELSQALEKVAPQVLDFQRSIGELCGGFVVVDSGGNIAMVHQTAREYLLGQKRAFSLDQQAAHEQLFLRCMSCLLEAGLRAKINRGQPPEFLDYAATSWFSHLCSSSPNSEVLGTLIKFLKGPYILTWIHAQAQSGQLRVLVSASAQLHTFALKMEKLDSETMSRNRRISEREVVESWAIDLVRIVAKFGSNLIKSPDSIHKFIPPFCPRDSITYQQFGSKESRNLTVSGISTTGWDDLLARLSFGAETYSSRILATGNKILVMSPAGNVIVYHSSTFEQIRKIRHGERLRLMVANTAGTLLVTYGYKTTKVWNLSSGKCTKLSSNPLGGPQPLTLLFTDNDDAVLLGADDGRIWSLSLSISTACWDIMAELGEQQMERSIINSPNCMALSPDGSQVALGYRGHPLSIWEVEGQEPINHYIRNTHHSSTSEDAWGEVVQLTWRPYTGEVIGLYSEGVVFKWNPDDDESKEIRAGAARIAVSSDGNFLATGDANGNIKLFGTDEFSLVYKLASQDLVLDVAFSPDMKRFYDIRGTYGNVWEPNPLIRLSELSEKGSGSASDAGSSAQRSNVPESWTSKIDPITALAAQNRGPLYCFGTEDGITGLFEAGRGKVGEPGRPKAFMTTEQITWSEDGQFVAFADLSGRVFVKAIIPSGKSPGPWTVESTLEILINITQGPILQLLFSRDSSTLLVYTSSTLSTISLALKTITLSHGFGSTPTPPLRSKWLNHPSEVDLLMGIGYETIDIWSWTKLTPLHSFSYKSSLTGNEENLSKLFSPAETLESDKTSHLPASPQNQNVTESLKAPAPNSSAPPEDNYFARRKHSASNAWDVRDSVERVLLTVDKTLLLVQLSHTTLQHQSRNQKSLLLFDTSSFSISDDATELKPFTLPEDVVSRVETPLSFISKDRLVFLDKDHWLCSWKLPLHPPLTSRGPGLSYSHHTLITFSSSPPARGRTSSSVGKESIDRVNRISELKQHFFLPGDWIGPNCVALCTVMADGTVLCPRNGEVAIVKCLNLEV
jgi:hypothetical protein